MIIENTKYAMVIKEITIRIVLKTLYFLKTNLIKNNLIYKNK
jgi:hypothetical protein